MSNTQPEILLPALATFIAALVGAGTWFVNRRKQQVDETTAASALVWKVAEAADARAEAAQKDSHAAREAALRAEDAAGGMRVRIGELEAQVRVLEGESRAWRTWCSQNPPCLVRGN